MAGLFVPNPTPKQIANARKWIAALRSGEYEQGRGALCITMLNGRKQWCCLGVGCDVVGLLSPADRGFLHYGEMLALGLCTKEGLFDNTHHALSEMSLDALNDRLGAPFLQIADVIEEELALVTEGTA